MWRYTIFGLITLPLPSGVCVQLGADKSFCLRYFYITLQQYLRSTLKCHLRVFFMWNYGSFFFSFSTLEQKEIFLFLQVHSTFTVLFRSNLSCVSKLHLKPVNWPRNHAKDSFLTVGKRLKEWQLSRFKWCCRVLSSIGEFENVRSVRYFIFMDNFTKELIVLSFCYERQ